MCFDSIITKINLYILTELWVILPKKDLTIYRHIAAFHTQRPGNYSICLLGQKNLTKIFVVKA